MNCSLQITNGKQFSPATVVEIGKRLVMIAAVTIVIAVPVFPQNSELQQKLAAVKQAAAENKQKLLQYQWTETTQLTLKGDPREISADPMRRSGLVPRFKSANVY